MDFSQLRLWCFGLDLCDSPYEDRCFYALRHAFRPVRHCAGFLPFPLKMTPPNYYAGFGIVILALGGIYLDTRLQTGALWTMIGILLGIVYLAYEIWKSTLKK
jgi:hypothetical protein